MTIRPIDYTTLISKAQEVSKMKDMKNIRYKNQAEISITQQEKQVEKNTTTIQNIDETENLVIDTKKERERKRHRKQKRKKDGKKDRGAKNIGQNIDVRI